MTERFDDDRSARLAILVSAAVLAAVVGWVLFYVVPDSLAELLGVVLTIAAIYAGVRFGGSVAASRFPDYNAAEVAVDGPITRDGGPAPLPRGGQSTSADDVVEQIEAADGDDHAQALVLRLDTPGGEVVPSDDIRRAALAFEGPTVAYATDVCASGGYWIASGCDELWAHDASIVGSIGVIGSSVNASDLADRLGVSYERFVAGRYKDAGTPLKELGEDERAYLQGIIDDLYDRFIERVAEGRGMDPDLLRETEARVYLGDEAHDLGLVDELGTREDVEARVSELIGTEVELREFSPSRSLVARLRGGAESVAYAFGAGVAGRFAPEAESLRFRF